MVECLEAGVLRRSPACCAKQHKPSRLKAAKARGGKKVPRRGQKGRKGPGGRRMSKASGGESKNTLYCSFCGKSQHEVRKLIAGPTVFICDECVELCMEIIREENKTSFMKSKEGVPTPQEIFKDID